MVAVILCNNVFLG